MSKLGLMFLINGAILIMVHGFEQLDVVFNTDFDIMMAIWILIANCLVIFGDKRK